MGRGLGFGKTILFGEHFVVHGVPGIVSAIDAACDAEAKKVDTSGINVRDERKGSKGYTEKKRTQQRPLFVSGPLPVDFAVGHDHIAASIGGAFTSGFGADYLCDITPAEHLSLPIVDDIKKGLIACKIAAHVGDSLKFGLNRLFKPDLELSRARFVRNWKEQFKHSLDPEEPIKKHGSDLKECTMCGKYCALALSKEILR